jgi:hypothetical protein
MTTYDVGSLARFSYALSLATPLKMRGRVMLRHRMSQMMTSTLLRLQRYETGSPLHRSDQITVPAGFWEDLHRDHEHALGRPVFVAVSESAGGLYDDGGVVGRVRPGARGADVCIVPDWMWLRLGAPEEDFWCVVAERPITDAGRITLRPRRAATLADSVDPLGMLTAALSGAAGGGEHGWACLMSGMELPLACGVFDVVEMVSLDGFPVSVGCILDMDVRLDLLEALDEPRPAPAQPKLLPVPAQPSSGVMWFHGMENVIDGNYWTTKVRGSGYRC